TASRSVPGCGIEMDETESLRSCRREPLLVSPAGDAMLLPAPTEVCASQWVRWSPHNPLECIEHPNFPARTGMLAMLGSDLYVARDDSSLYVYDRASERTDRLPILGARYLNFSIESEDGRTLIFGSYGGPLLRASAAGVELVNGTQSACSRPRPPRASP